LENRLRQDDNIKIYLKEIGWNGVDWVRLAQDKYTWRALLTTFGYHKMQGIFLTI
jgi:hypothetical protein